MLEKMSKRWLQITDLKKQEIEEFLERRNPLVAREIFIKDMNNQRKI